MTSPPCLWQEEPVCLQSVEHRLSPAFVGQEGPQTVGDGGGERSRLHAEVEQLQAGTVELTVVWAQGGAGRLLRQLRDNKHLTLNKHLPGVSAVSFLL